MSQKPNPIFIRFSSGIVLTIKLRSVPNIVLQSPRKGPQLIVYSGRCQLVDFSNRSPQLTCFLSLSLHFLDTTTIISDPRFSQVVSLSLNFLPIFVPLLPFTLAQSDQGAPIAAKYASGPYAGENIPFAVATGDTQAAWIHNKSLTNAQLASVASLLSQSVILNNSLSSTDIKSYFPAGAAAVVEDNLMWFAQDQEITTVAHTDQAMVFDESNPDWSTLWQLANNAFGIAIAADKNNVPFKLVMNLWTNDQMSPPNPLCTTVTLEALQPYSQTLYGNMVQDLHVHFQMFQKACNCQGLTAFTGGTKVLMRNNKPRWRMSMQVNGASCVPW